MSAIRLCRPDETASILAIVNAAATAYRGVIPPDCWHEPYMSSDDLSRERHAGVELWGFEQQGELTGVMGMQAVHDADLIRHAYVRPDCQRQGIGAALLDHVCRRGKRRMLVGTWATASWAISFYRRHGFEAVSPGRTAVLLRTYWTIPERQIGASVVLARDVSADSSSGLQGRL